MSKTRFVIIFVSLIAMSLFICVGYAALSDTLNITGNAVVEGKPYEGVVILKVDFVGSSNATNISNDFELPTNHQITADASRSGGSVTYKITVFNNTDVTQWYLGPRYVTSYEQNALIGQGNGISIRTADRQDDSSHSFNTDDWVPAKTERDFYVTYTYGSNAQSACSTLINFSFGIKMDAVHDEFLGVLNNVYSDTSYQTLANAFNTQYATNGSVSISSKTHPELFASMFGDLQVNIDGTEKTANVVIRRENLDNDLSSGDNYSGSGPKGCEYTLYITVESMTPGSQPTVYAISYSQGAEGMGDDWYQVGELYEGTAQIDANGNIDYSTWKATHKTYEIADGITYVVGAPNGDQYDIMKTMEQLISAEDQDIFNTIDNTNIFKKTYDIIQQHRSSTDPAIIRLREAFDDASKFYVNHNNGQEFKVVRNKYTRAEIIYALKNIQSALDYYYQTFPGS